MQPGTMRGRYEREGGNTLRTLLIVGVNFSRFVICCVWQVLILVEFGLYCSG